MNDVTLLNRTTAKDDCINYDTSYSGSPICVAITTGECHGCSWYKHTDNRVKDRKQIEADIAFNKTCVPHRPDREKGV